VGDVFLVCGGRGRGWDGLGVFPFDGFRGVGGGFVGRLFWREGNWGGCLMGGVVVRRVGVWLWYWGGVRDGRRGNGDVRVLESGVIRRGKQG